MTFLHKILQQTNSSTVDDTVTDDTVAEDIVTDDAVLTLLG